MLFHAHDTKHPNRFSSIYYGQDARVDNGEDESDLGLHWVAESGFIRSNGGTVDWTLANPYETGTSQECWNKLRTKYRLVEIDGIEYFQQQEARSRVVQCDNKVMSYSKHNFEIVEWVK